MSEQTLHRPLVTKAPASSDSADDAPSPLLAQADAHARVAREALADTQHVLNAEQELTRRHNRSGQ